MTIQVKRVYEKASKIDGPRILVDRLWPRGITKVKANITYWAKDLAPSGELRSWFHADRESRFKEFQKKYLVELKADKANTRRVMKEYGGSYTLITSAKDVEHSHIPTLLNFLRKL